MKACDTCPFSDLCGHSPAEMKEMLQHNYDTNYMDCRSTFPKWKPGFCHRGGIVCAGYLEPQVAEEAMP